MLEGAIKLFTIREIEVRLDYSWFIVFALVTYMLAADQFPAAWPLYIRGTLGLVTSLLFFLSVLLHELAHSFVAQAQGIKVPRITLFIFGGAAQIAEEPKSAGNEFLMAMAGPAMSVVIAIVSGLLYFLFIKIHHEPMAALFKFLSIINVSLAVFNLVPGFPLDGGRVLRAMIWGASKDLDRSTRIAAIAGQVVALGFMGLGVGLFLFTGAVYNGLWLGFIGWFLLRAARQTLARVEMQQALAGHSAGELMWSDCLYVDADTPLSELFDQQVLRAGRRCFPVMRDGRVAGMVTADHFRRVPSYSWSTTRVEAVMTPAEAVQPIATTMPLDQVLDRMARDGVSFLPVVSDGVFKGIVSRDALQEFLRINNVGRSRWGF